MGLGCLQELVETGRCPGWSAGGQAQVRENLDDHRGLFDGGDDRQKCESESKAFPFPTHRINLKFIIFSRLYLASSYDSTRILVMTAIYCSRSLNVRGPQPK